ncbi:PAS domain S-box protein [Paracoccus sp. S-4012]|uniref:PAS domain S-box protein n=1 Tax=Paracoccus sp. S-4012 TaxID=2665648 RepID=UPI0012AF0C15|nr:PAS domain S-box protein [Paracoccus sp. S-4012]MRX51646.1 PAS domain S-box protein [Paracoccus sp. S-4012]
MSVLDENLQQHFSAIIEGSDDAIVAKDLNSIILSWNPAAERIFGYAAVEVLGKPITIVIPEDRQHEEVDFIERLRRGERIQHFETLRKKKNGELFPISVTISPIRDRDGEVVGASKIARDITDQHRAAEQQRLLLSEMKHRVGNSFAIASGLLRLCADQSSSVDEFVGLMRGRLLALASAHSMAAPAIAEGARASGERPLKALLESILQPFAGSIPAGVKVDDIIVSRSAVTPLALVFYELCTNSVKYGTLASGDGRLSITSDRLGHRLIINWTESFKRTSEQAVQGQGFGTAMCEVALRDQMDGTLERTFAADGMRIRLDLSYRRVTADG